MTLTHLIAFRFLRGAGTAAEPVPEVPPVLIINIFEVYKPISLSVVVNDIKDLSTFTRSTSIEFNITSQARYRIPRISIAASDVFITIIDPSSVVRVSKALCTKIDGPISTAKYFYYAYQTEFDSAIGPWTVILQSLLFTEQYLTPPFVAFILK